jgi:hypothetical protein
LVTSTGHAKKDNKQKIVNLKGQMSKNCGGSKEQRKSDYKTIKNTHGVAKDENYRSSPEKGTKIQSE